MAKPPSSGERDVERAPSHLTLRNLRLIAAGALAGSVLAGVFFGAWVTSFDPRSIGAPLGALAVAILLWREVIHRG